MEEQEASRHHPALIVLYNSVAVVEVDTSNSYQQCHCARGVAEARCSGPVGAVGAEDSPVPGLLVDPGDSAARVLTMVVVEVDLAKVATSSIVVGHLTRSAVVAVPLDFPWWEVEGEMKVGPCSSLASVEERETDCCCCCCCDLEGEVENSPFYWAEVAPRYSVWTARVVRVAEVERCVNYSSRVSCSATVEPEVCC